MQLGSYTLQRRQCSPRIGGGRLLKASQEAFLASPMVTGFSTTLTAVKLHEEVDSGALCVFIRSYVSRSLPPACHFDRGDAPLPSVENIREARLPEMAAGPEL
jgi:hypothetical protein